MATHLPDPFDRPLTHRDLDQTPDDGNRYEVIDGALHVTPFPSTAHQQVATRITVALFNHVDKHGLGQVFMAGLKVVLDEPTGVGPDVVYVSNDRMDGLKPDAFYGAPDLVIEILSSKPSLDQVVKKQLYARAGIPHYWIVDPQAHRLWAYRQEGERYRLTTDLQGSEPFTPDLFPGLVVQLGDIWG